MFSAFLGDTSERLRVQYDFEMIHAFQGNPAQLIIDEMCQ